MKEAIGDGTYVKLVHVLSGPLDNFELINPNLYSFSSGVGSRPNRKV